MNRSAVVALVVVALDAMGMGLIMPVLPALLRELASDRNFVAHLGALLSLYALMQVFCAPVLGRLSDVYGRRRILLFSLAGAAVDYAVMAAAPILWVLYAGRMIAGVTGATGAVAASTIADVTQPDRRAKWFGYMGACYGAGMIGGPMLGGLLGGLGVHAPFWGAAILNALGFLLAYAVLQKAKRPQAHSPLRAAFQIRVGFRPEEALRKSAALLLVFFLIQLIGQIPGALWVLHGESRFHWNTLGVGVSLAVFGVAHTLFQALATGPLTRRFGEQRTLVFGMMADGAGFVLMALATQTWMVLPVITLLAAGGAAMPALQSMLSNRVQAGGQGVLQGRLTSLTNLTSIVGPLGFTALYAATAKTWSGWPWISGALLYAACLLLLAKGGKQQVSARKAEQAPN